MTQLGEQMTSDERREARAEMEAAKARAKALRPWYKKKLIIIPLVLLGFIVLIASLGGGGDGGSGGDSDDDAVVQAQIPGEATLDVTGEKTTTRFTGVSLRNESIPGNEFSRAPEGKTFMVFNTEIENVGDEDLDLNSSVYRLKLPDGQIIDYGLGSMADDELGFGVGTTLTPGAKKVATLSWEIPNPTSGQNYAILWKPNPFDDKQAQFTYTHR